MEDSSVGSESILFHLKVFLLAEFMLFPILLSSTSGSTSNKTRMVPRKVIHDLFLFRKKESRFILILPLKCTKNRDYGIREFPPFSLIFRSSNTLFIPHYSSIPPTIECSLLSQDPQRDSPTSADQISPEASTL